MTGLGANPAAAQVGTSVSLFSEEWLRGQPVSDGHPVARLDLSYDHKSGVYVGGSAGAVVTSASTVRLLGFRSYAGIARRLGSGLVLDAGIADIRYTKYGSLKRSAGYSEAYLGLAKGPVSGRLSYSPFYLQKDRSTLYAELNAVFEPAANWRLTGHAGALSQLSGPTPADTYRSRLDWRLAGARRLGRLNLELALTGTGPDSDRPDLPEQSERALILGAVYAF